MSRQLRIIAGSLGGRQFRAPYGHRTHPMGDKPRGALFAVLGDVSGLTVLDPFAGSGALSFEALSRGASSSIAIENDRTAQQTITDNTTALGLASNLRLYRSSAQTWSASHPDQQFDLILCDPPYDKLPLTTLQRLVRHLRPDGTYVLSWPASQPVPDFPGLHLVVSKTYAEAQLVFYRQTS